MRTKALFIAIVLIIVLLFAGCNADGVGIFYTVSKEVKLSGSDLSGLFIRSFASDGTSTYAGAGPSVWKDTGSSWKNITPSGKGAEPTIASFGTSIFVPLYDESDSTREKSVWEYDGSGWSKTGLAADTGITMMILDTDGTYDFVVISDDNSTYSVYYTPDFTTLTAVTNMSALDYPVFDAAYNGTGYVLIGGDSSTGTAFSGDGTTMATAAGLPSAGFGGVAEDGTDFFITAKNGSVYESTDDGANWSVVGTAPDNYSGETPELFDLEVVTFGSNYLVIGADEGYYEMALSGTSIIRPSATIASGIDIESSYATLAEGYVRTFYTDGTDGLFLMGTETGVWENSGGTLDQM